MLPASAAATATTCHPSLFRAYDIRGIVDETLFEKDAFLIGKAFASELAAQHKTGPVVVARDGRMSSPMLEAALVEGLMSAGATVIRLHLGPTPWLYFAAYTLNAAGGIMVTGSHNPPNHNGFKFVWGKSPFFGSDIKQLEARILAGDLRNQKGQETSHTIAPQLMDEYLYSLTQAYTTKKALNVAWDAGNGAAGDVVQSLCGRLPGEHIPLFTTIDGTFPNHHPDPTVPENLVDLITTVRTQHCDVGVAFDGDGDRVGVVDNQGRIIWGDQLLLLLARDVLKTNPGATIIADVKASQMLFDGIAAAKGVPLMWKTGHSLIKAKMAETGAVLAGEMSGHVFFADKYFGFDDGIYAAVRLLDMIARSPFPLSHLLDQLPFMHNTPELRILCSEERKFAVIEEVKARIAAKGIAFNDVDGLRVMHDGGWWLLRASNTQAALVARCEAPTDTQLLEQKAMLVEQLRLSGVALQQTGH